MTLFWVRTTIASTIIVVFLLNTYAYAQSEKLDSHDSSKWHKDIAKFETTDSENPPPKNAILFVGSSSIRKWDLKKSFPDLVTINRGFGGSQMADSVQFMEQLVLEHKPNAVVVYAGDNDLGKGKSPERVFADFSEFVAILKKKLPKTKIHYIAIKPSIKRWNLIEKVRFANQLIESYCKLHPDLHFVDISTPMLDKFGSLKPELFAKDGLHLSEEGYQVWTKKVLESIKMSRAE